jgi:7,8-dihydropterin-6-yl-methyl-4-(beta-D-ribofuranosyl)aminobenzene 5'-phosphate synthase
LEDIEMNQLNIMDADRIEITSLVDNYTDWLKIESTETTKRAIVPPGNTMLAEHGLSLIIKVFKDGGKHTLLMDAAVSPQALINNIEALNVNLDEIEAIILSHGHIDHFGGLVALLEKLPAGIELYLHPEAFLERRMNIKPMGIITDLPQLDEGALLSKGAEIHKIKEPVALCSNLIATSGETTRLNDFETGFTWPEAKVDGQWVRDPFNDDLSIAINLKDKGLVIIGGCSHKGIINIINQEQEITGVNKVHAVLGGFHLTGPQFEPIIGRAISEMEKIDPDFVIPMHCSGWTAITSFEREMPEQFLLNTVGTTYIFRDNPE